MTTNPMEIAVGGTAVVRNLRSRPEHNGLVVVLNEFLEATGRWGVQGVAEPNITLALRPENLEPLESAATSSSEPNAEGRDASDTEWFGRIVTKYGLGEGSRLDDLLAFLTADDNTGSATIAERSTAFAKRFGVTDPHDASLFVSRMARVAAETCEEAMEVRFPQRKAALESHASGKKRSLRTALLASDHASLALPESATFERLDAKGVEVPLTDARELETCVGHTSYLVPCDTQSVLPATVVPSATTATSSSSSTNPLAETVHCFRLLPSVATPLNRALRTWAEARERLAHEEAHRRTESFIAGPGSHVGLRLSNIGGFASWQDVFASPATHDEGADTPSSASVEEREGRRQARRLHAIVSMAIDLASSPGPGACGGGDGVGSSSAHADEAPGRERASGVTSGEQAADADNGVCDGVRDQGLHAMTAWLNVNRGRDYNEMHVHPPELWSAVYYVAAGESYSAHSTYDGDGAEVSAAAASGGGGHGDAAAECAGHMIFRAGRADGLSAGHTYFPVAPVPGSLWLFPGRMPHMVMGTPPPTASTPQSPTPPRARVSVAVNCTFAAPPPPTAGAARRPDPVAPPTSTLSTVALS